MALVFLLSQMFVGIAPQAPPVHIHMQFHRLGIWKWEISCRHLTDREVNDFVDAVGKACIPVRRTQVDQEWAGQLREYHLKLNMMRAKLLQHRCMMDPPFHVVRFKRLGRFRIHKRSLE